MYENMSIIDSAIQLYVKVVFLPDLKGLLENDRI
jgi:hypothetical protein